MDLRTGLGYDIHPLVQGRPLVVGGVIIENSKRVAELGAWLLMTPHGCAARVKDVPDSAVRFMTHIRNIA